MRVPADSFHICTRVLGTLLWATYVLAPFHLGGHLLFSSHVLLRLPLSSETSWSWPAVLGLVHMLGRSQCRMALRSYGSILLSGSAWFANISWKSECSALRQWCTTSSGKTTTTPSPSAHFCGRCEPCDAPNDFLQTGACAAQASLAGAESVLEVWDYLWIARLGLVSDN